VWLILCPGCRKDLEQLSHRRQRVVGCVDGVAGLEGRLGKLSHATKVCLEACSGDDDRGWRGAMWMGRVNTDLAVGESCLFLTCGHDEMYYLRIVDGMVRESGCAWAVGRSEVGIGQSIRLGVSSEPDALPSFLPAPSEACQKHATRESSSTICVLQPHTRSIIIICAKNFVVRYQ
jgi:hypothetical protein